MRKLFYSPSLFWGKEDDNENDKTKKSPPHIIYSLLFNAGYFIVFGYIRISAHKYICHKLYAVEL